MAPVVYNASIIICAVVLEPVMGIHGVAVGVVLGAVGHVAIQLPAAALATNPMSNSALILSRPWRTFILTRRGATL